MLQAAQECGIVYTTAKVILNNYRKEGRVGKLQHRKKKIKTDPNEIFNETIITIRENKVFNKN